MKQILVILLIVSISGYRFELSMQSNSDNICENYKWLNYNSKYLISIDYKLTDKQTVLVNKIYDRFENDSCSDVNFSIPFFYKQDTIHLPFSCYINCYDCLIEAKEYNHCTLLMNKDNLIMFENNLIKKDSINSFIKDYYNDFYLKESLKNNSFDIFVAWDYGLTKEQIDVFFTKVLQGYYEFLKARSIVEFGKKFCSLHKNEILILIKKYHFRFTTSFYGVFKNGKYIESKG